MAFTILSAVVAIVGAEVTEWCLTLVYVTIFKVVAVIVLPVAGILGNACIKVIVVIGMVFE